MISSWAVFASLAVASNPKQEAADLDLLSKSVHNATRSQLNEYYNAYAAQMAKYLQDLPSYKNICLNFNLINKRNHGAIDSAISKNPGVPMFAEFREMTAKADLDIMQDVTNARVARQNLVKITTPDAIKQIDQNHQGVLPNNISQIKPPSSATKASDLK